MEPSKEWFSEWFDSPYYHILYKNRDMQEAEFFLQNLVNKLGFTPSQELVDLACGKGRHSIFLNSLGFHVTGVDLAAHSIAAAKQFENERLHFEVQDLRNLPYIDKFDVALNLFTSFGYFDCDDTNKTVISQIYKSLKPNGTLVIDFMNVACVLSRLVYEEIKVVDGIEFHISKRVVGDLILKRIEFTDGGKAYAYSEEVQVLTLDDFKRLLDCGGFELKATYGNYKLEPFDVNSSDRLILVATKNV